MSAGEGPLVVQHDGAGAFFIEQDGQRVGLMAYTRTGADAITIDHTEVGDALRGRGAGKLLVAAAVEWARAEGIRITPVCPFARKTFDKDPALRDVLAS